MCAVICHVVEHPSRLSNYFLHVPTHARVETPVVIIKLIAGHNLPVTDVVLQNSDPFFVFEGKPDGAVGGTQKQRSTHKPRTLNPKWYS